MRLRQPKPTVGVVLCAGLVLVAGCSESTGEPLELAEDALWTQADFGATDLYATYLRGDVAVVPSEDTLAAIDLPTGESLWSADDGEPLLGGNGALAERGWWSEVAAPVVRDLGEHDWEVLVSYRKPVGDIPADASLSRYLEFEYGVAALSGVDGQVQWISEPLVRGDRESPVDVEVRPLYADDETVVAVSTAGVHPDSMRTWAIDPQTAQPRWHQDAVWPSALAGGVVTVEDVTDANLAWTVEGPEREGATVRALDVADGEPVWDMSADFETSTVDVSSGDYVVVRGKLPDGEREDTVVIVDAETGQTVEEVERAYLCDASDVMIACPGGSTLHTYQTDGDELQVETSEPFDGSSLSLDGVYGTTVVAQQTGADEGWSAVDAEGLTRAEGIPGRTVSLTEEYGVFCETASDCAVYATDSDLRPERVDESDLAPLDLEDALLWSTSTFRDDSDLDVTGLSDVDLVHDAVVLHGDGRHDGPAIITAESASGDVRWSVEGSNQLGEHEGSEVHMATVVESNPLVAEHEDDWSVLVAAATSADSGVAALEGETGDLAWYLPLAGPDADVSVRAAHDGHAAVEIFEDGARSTSVVELTEGGELWSLADSRPIHLGEGVAAVQHLEVNDEGNVDVTGVSLLSLDEEPEERWSAEGLDAGHSMVETGNGVVVVGGPDGTVVVDSASGEELTSIGRRLFDCFADGDVLLCASSPIGGNGRAVAPVRIEVTEGGAEARELRHAAVHGINGVHDGRFFTGSAYAADGGFFTIDENGVIVDEGVPNTFRAANGEGHALFVDETTSTPQWEVWDLG